MPEFPHVNSNRSRRALSGVLWSAVTMGLPAITALAVFTFASRLLTPSEFGLVTLAASIALIAAAFAPSGFRDAIVQFGALEARHLDTVFWLSLGISATLYAALVALAWPLSHWFGHIELVPLIAIIGLRVIFDSLAIVPNALLLRNMKFHLVARRTVVASISSAFICLALLYSGYGIWALAMSQLLTSGIACLAAIFSVAWRPAFRFDGAAFFELQRVGIFSSGHKVIQVLSLDQVLIASFLGTASLGFFGFARRIFQIINDFISGGLGSVSHVLLSSLQGERDKLREAFLLSTFTSSVLAFPIFSGLAAVSSLAVPIFFGANWVPAVPALQGFCAIGLLTCVGTLQGSLVNSHGRADWWMYYQLAKQVVTVCVILLTYRFGMTVMVFGIAATAWLLWPVSALKTCQLLEMPVWKYLRRFVAPAIGALGVYCAATVSIRVFSDTAPLSRLTIAIFAGSVIYAAIIAATSHRQVRSIWVKVRKRVPA